MNEQRVTDMVLKLNRETASGKVRWTPRSTDPSSLQSGERMIGLWYETTIKDRLLRLYKLKTPTYNPYEDEWHTMDSFRLEFIDSSKQPEWVFPNDIAIVELHATVTRQVSGADQFIDAFLQE